MDLQLFGVLIGTFFLTVVILFLINPLAKHVGLLDHPDDDRKLHEGIVPLTGGFVLLLTLAIVFNLSGVSAVSLSEAASFWTVTGIAMAVLVAFHAMDDIFELRAVSRFVFDAIIAFVLWSYAAVRLNSLGDLFGFGEIVVVRSAIVMTIFCFIATSNAFNWVDGIDGLCAGLALICFATLFVLIQLSNGSNESLAYSLLFIIAAIMPLYIANLSGFGKKLKTFLGDSGARLIGFMAAIGLILAARQELILPVMAYFPIAVPVCDCLALMGQRMLQGRSPLSADRLHLHHLLRDVGFNDARSRQLILMGALGMALCGIIIQLIAPPEWIISCIVVASFAGFIAFRIWLQRLISAGARLGAS